MDGFVHWRYGHWCSVRVKYNCFWFFIRKLKENWNPFVAESIYFNAHKQRFPNIFPPGRWHALLRLHCIVAVSSGDDFLLHLLTSVKPHNIQAYVERVGITSYKHQESFLTNFMLCVVKKMSDYTLGCRVAVFLLLIADATMAFQWENSDYSRWTYSCDFPFENNFASKASLAGDCGKICQETSPCTQFVWTNLEVGYSKAINVSHSFNLFTQHYIMYKEEIISTNFALLYLLVGHLLVKVT